MIRIDNWCLFSILLQNVDLRAATDVRQLPTWSLACSSATSAAPSACVFRLAPTVTNKNALATITGRHRRASPSVPEKLWEYLTSYSIFSTYLLLTEILQKWIYENNCRHVQLSPCHLILLILMSVNEWICLVLRYFNEQ